MYDEGIKVSYLDYIFNKKDQLGKVLFLVSIFVLIGMFIFSLNDIFIHIDERFTIYLIQLPLFDAFNLAVFDVHPPLYYAILKIPCMILSFLGIDYNVIVVSRFVSFIPYVIILIISGTKLKKEYGWFSAGLFVFAIATMSDFFIQFLTLRMYNWGLLFLLLSFIYLKGILSESDKKSWILFSFFTLLGAYTHYILIITSGILYLGLLIYYLLNNKTEIKKWFASAFGVILLYLPWIIIFISQILDEQSKGNSSVPNIINFFNYFSGYALRNQLFYLSTVFLKILAIILLIFFLRRIWNLYSFKKDTISLYMFFGILAPIFTIILGTIFLTFTFKPMEIRYLVPSLSILWLTISIFMGKLKNKQTFAVVLAIILLFGCVNIIDTTNFLHDNYDLGFSENELLTEINNDDTIIVYTNIFNYICYHNDLNNTIEYTTDYVQDLPYAIDVDFEDLPLEEMYNLPSKNPNKTVYKIKFKDNNYKKDEPNKVIGRGNMWIVEVK